MGTMYLKTTSCFAAISVWTVAENAIGVFSLVALSAMTVEAPRINPVIAKHNIFLIIILYPLIGLGVIIQFYINMIEKSFSISLYERRR